ncbi:Rab9 effector protein with kelch motifs [Plakobranchus ocellatus]|uniref:Rab9 effector protein with kelch motifs n=1 Tax=Plakobranchus ocellatus TaxID=259542 RepID=A0AAV4DWU1_9GAST|nr:Rab9 effector protein with kelch motifs [Plakobranchus ocellatus]
MELHPFLEGDQRPSPRWWYVLSTTGDSPSMRVGHSATFVPGESVGESGRVFIIGGANPSQVFDEVWTLDLTTRAWDTVECPGFRGRYEHAAFRVGNHSTKIFIFGGATQEGCLNDVQSMDVSTGTWVDVEVSGTPPAPRTHRSAAVVGSKVYFFSGGHCGSEPVADRSVHCLDTETWAWTALTPKGNAPKARHGHLMVAATAAQPCQTASNAERTCKPSSDDRVRPSTKKDSRNGVSAEGSGSGSSSARIYVHGGMSGATFFDDLHVLDVERCTWSLVRKKRTSPSPRAAHDGLIHNNQLVIFGGMSQEKALDDAHQFNPEGNSWTKLEFDGPAPPNRLDFAMCAIQLSVPAMSAASMSDAQLELTGASSSTKEVLERELKPGSASSRDSFSDSASVDEALFTLDKGDTTQEQGQKANHNHSAILLSREATHPTEEEQEASYENIDLLFIHGGMDTEGEIFDDTLVLALTS